MVDVLPSPTFGQELSSSSNPVDMSEISDRFMSVNMNGGGGGSGGGQVQEKKRAENQPQHPHLQSQQQSEPSGAIHNPRRAFSTTDHPAVTPSISQALRTQERLITPAQTPREPVPVDSYFQIPHTDQPSRAMPAPTTKTIRGGAGHTPAWAGRRPQLPGPQRSYSLMDVEPVPLTHQPGVNLTLPLLPPELHYLLFEFLDPIDSTCLALTSSHFYAIHRRMHGSVKLGARREGPNDMEWVWRNAGPFIMGGQNPGSKRNGYGDDIDSCGQNALAGLSPRGQVYCRKCATARCELHNHIRDWMGPGMEYCALRQKFGPEAPEGADAVCRRSSPRHPQRCSRHTRQQRAIRLT